MSPPNANLTLLAELRERAGLTQADMARLCGLRGRQSHQTAGAWERGEITPGARRRTRFLGYLWDHLGLRCDHARFAAVWDLLVEAWGWAPIGDAEWAELTHAPRPGRAETPASSALPPPFQAPALTPHFVGRMRELDALRHLLCAEDAPPTVALVGMGGIGKTTLAIQAAHALRDHFADGVLWTNVATADPLDILQAWALAHGCDFSGLSDLENRAAAVRNLLARRRTLIVLDDVRAPERVRPLLPGGGQCAVLMTTRDRDAAVVLDARPVPLEELTLEDSLHLLTSIVDPARVDAEPDAARAICDLLHHLPLAIEISAKRLARAPWLPLADMAQRLTDASARLNRLALKDLSVRASLEISWAALDADLQHTFACVGVFAGRGFALPALAHVAQLDDWQAEEHAVSLVALSLLRPESAARYRPHPLVADFAREQLGDAADAQARLVEHYLDFARRHQTAYALLEPEWENVAAAMETAHRLGQWRAVLDYADALTEPWFTRARYTQARRGYAFARDAAIHLGDRHALAATCCTWARADIEQCDYAEARELLQKSLQIYTELGMPPGVADAQLQLGRLALERADFNEARKFLVQSRHINEELGRIQPAAEALYLEADIPFYAGEYAEAERLGRMALALQRVTNDGVGCIRSLGLLADIALKRGAAAAAAHHCGEALSLCDHLQEQAEQAVIRYILAEAHRVQGDLTLARHEIQHSIELFAHMGDRSMRAKALWRASLVEMDLGNCAIALQQAQQSRDLLHDLGNQWSLVFTLLQLGDVYQRLEDPDQAHGHWQEALTLAEQLEHPLAQDARQRLEQHAHACA
jgi:tetratricopeptide (TPR) repeat protein/transcriptional regulator with XRE-family HTH domain